MEVPHARFHKRQPREAALLLIPPQGHRAHRDSLLRSQEKVQANVVSPHLPPLFDIHFLLLWRDAGGQ